MRPSPAEPSITIIGNSVPPPSMRCTLVSVGQANFPYSESSHASATSVLRAAIPRPHVALSSGRYSTRDRKSTRLNSSHDQISYAVFCLKKKKKTATAHAAVQHSQDP